MKKHAVLCLALALISCSARSQVKGHHTDEHARVVLLGTGTPFADPKKSGPSSALIINNSVYLIDSGPGVVRRAVEANQRGIKELGPEKLNKVFITHLHSDHTAGLSDLYLTPAVIGRQGPLKIYGPVGIHNMATNIRAAYAEDIRIRTRGLEGADSIDYSLEAIENTEGIVFRDENVTVTAFKVKHGSWNEAYGYQFDLVSGQRVVFSGDCTYTDEIISHCNGCDLLIHEVYSEEALSKRPQHWKTYHSQFHTSTRQLAVLTKLAKPKLLILNHQLTWGMGDDQVLKEVKALYNGNVVSGNDLDVFEINPVQPFLIGITSKP